MHTHISVEFIPSRVSESCKSMTHFPPVTLVKQSQPRLFSLRHDFSANNTLAHVGYISLITHTPVKIRHDIRHEIQKYERRGGNHEMRRLFFFSLSTYRNPSRDFQFGPTTAGGKKCRPAHSIFSDALPLHTTEHTPPNYYASQKRVRAGRWKVFHENLRDSEYNRKYEGGSTERNTSPCPTPRPNLAPPSSSLLYFPNNGPLKSNFANISARQLCLLPFRSFPRGKETRAPPKSRTRGNFFGNRSLSRIVATIYTCTWKYAHDREGIREVSFRCRETSAGKKEKRKRS